MSLKPLHTMYMKTLEDTQVLRLDSLEVKRYGVDANDVNAGRKAGERKSFQDS